MTSRPETLPSAQLLWKGSLSVNPADNKPFTGIAIEHYHNGKNPFDISKVKTRTTFKHGRKDGLCERYYENVQLYLRENYNNGERHGPWEEFHENGRLESTGNFKDGKRHGPWERFHENGQSQFKKNYREGNPDGPLKYFDENGRLASNNDFFDDAFPF